MDLNRRTCLGGLAAAAITGIGFADAGQPGKSELRSDPGRKLEPARILLPKPQTTIGRPLMQVLQDRRSIRDFKPDRLPRQMLSNLLWAAFGINRPDGRRTAPSARNWQEIEIFLATADGLFVFDAKAHVLDCVMTDDLRGLTGTQSFTTEAPLNLVYVADLSKAGDDPGEQDTFVPVDSAFIAQNVYLFCASEGLATVFRGSVDRARLTKAMRLPEKHKVLFAQTVGYERLT
jgi:hypothetical protein